MFAKICQRTVGTAAILILAIVLHPTMASAAPTGFDLGAAAQYVILYQGGSSGSQLSINNFGTTGIWTGNIGIAGTGKLAASGPGTLNGNINFAAANTGQASISNTTINGSINFGVSAVQTLMNTLNTLSSTLGAIGGTALTINTSSDQTVLTSTGTFDAATGNRIFTVSSVNTGNGENLIIKGDGGQNVVFNVNTAGEAQFHGNILLQDLTGKFFGELDYTGLTPNQVLFNLYQGAGNTGGDKLSLNNNGNAAHPLNRIYGTFLDPNGEISVVNTRFVGHLFGGDSANMQVVSGDTLILPPPVGAPEPASLTLIGTSLLGLAFLARKRNRK